MAQVINPSTSGKVIPNVAVEQSLSNLKHQPDLGERRSPMSMPLPSNPLSLNLRTKQDRITVISCSMRLVIRDGSKKATWQALIRPEHETIKAVTKAAGWGRKLPEGHGLGLAFFLSHSGHIAEVAEVSVDGKNITVHDVWVAADVGQVVNLSGLENQLQGSVIDGLSAMAASASSSKMGLWFRATTTAIPCCACRKVHGSMLIL